MDFVTNYRHFSQKCVIFVTMDTRSFSVKDKVVNRSQLPEAAKKHNKFLKELGLRQYRRLQYAY